MGDMDILRLVNPGSSFTVSQLQNVSIDMYIIIFTHQHLCLSKALFSILYAADVEVVPRQAGPEVLKKDLAGDLHRWPSGILA